MVYSTFYLIVSHKRVVEHYLHYLYVLGSLLTILHSCH